jgi:asparagine synthase (glutamine-hydrolysing)
MIARHARRETPPLRGIFGLWRLDGRPVQAPELAGMAAAMRHRMAGVECHLAESALGIGPVAHPVGGGQLLVCDARIDNREELLSALPALHGDVGASDASILAAAVEMWGEAAPGHLRGDFALAVWNATRRQIWCARDHFGVKPLYYVLVPGRLFAFASDVEALLSLPGIPREIDDDMAARHLQIPIGDDPARSYYRAVRKVLPAHVLKIGSADRDESPYWAIDLSKELRLSSIHEYAAALRDAFTEAVRCRLASEAPVGSMLSGGLDSSAIACVAARIRPNTPLHTLSAVYPSVPESDERRDIEEILAGIHAIPHFLAADSVDPLAGVDEMNRLAGGAIRGRNLYLNWQLFGLAREAGVGVVLDGFDGDSVVSHGWGYLHELAIAGRWWKLATVSLPFSYRRGTPPIADYRSLVRFGRVRRRADNGGATALPSLPTGIPIAPGFVSRYADRVEPREVRSREREIHGRHLHSGTLLEVLGWLEACAAGRSMDVRFPFFDVRVAELCVSLPADLKLRRGWTRFAMREALEGIVPRSAQWRRKKANMYQGWSHAMRTHEGGRVRELLARPSDAVAAYIVPERLREIYERFMAGTATQVEEASLWPALSLALWLSPIEGPVPQPPADPSSSMSPRSTRSVQ